MDVGTQPVPQLRPGVDPAKLPLTSPEEYFLVTRIDGRATVSELAAMIQKPEADTTRMLERLHSLGAIEFGTKTGSVPPRATFPPKGPDSSPRTSAPSPGSRPSVAPTDYGDFIFPIPLMMEQNDLPESERKRVIWEHEHLEIWNHYELLKTRRKDDVKAIKTAYFDRSKEWHPDRWKRFKNLGSFKKMIEHIFKRVADAYNVLSDEAQKKAYDKTVKPMTRRARATKR
jgi:hypothetical protein